MTNTQNINYAKFKVSDVLDEPIAGNVDIQKKDISDEGEIVVTSGLTDYGIKGRTTRKAKVVKEPSITIDMFGNVFYRDEPYKLVTHGRVYGFTSKLIKNREIGLYLVSALRPLGAKFSYNNMMTWSKLKDLSIELPVTPSGTPDFEYMEERIRELEEERIRELEAYLKVTGLSDATLTDEEQAALDKMNMGGVKWKKFKLGDIFIEKVQRGTRLVKSRRIPGSIPLVTAGEANRGVADWITHNKVLFPANSLTIDMFGNVFYRDQPFFADDNILVFSNNKKYSKKVMLFMSVAFSKALKGKFDYAHQFRQKSLPSVVVKLPVTSAGAIDFDFMENYITAIEKQSICGVIEYKDKVIQTTKGMVNAN